jgi:hypothetical protein
VAVAAVALRIPKAATEILLASSVLAVEVKLGFLLLCAPV